MEGTAMSGKMDAGFVPLKAQYANLQGDGNGLQHVRLYPQYCSKIFKFQ